MKLFFVLFLWINAAFGFSQEAVFSAIKPVHKFPKTVEGPVLSHEFVVKNTGKSPLVISNFRVSCTCTKVILPAEPILPGATGVVKITFDTNGKYYQQDRVIFLTTNTKKGEERLRFKIYVIPSDEVR